MYMVTHTIKVSISMLDSWLNCQVLDVLRYRLKIFSLLYLKMLFFHPIGKFKK